MALKTSPEWSPQVPRREAQKANLCPLPHKNTSFGGFFANLEDLGGRFGGRKKASKIDSKIAALGVENRGSGEAPGELFSEPKKEARGGAH